MKRIILVALASLALTQQDQRQPDGYWEVTFSEPEYSTFIKGQPGDPDYQGGSR